MAEELEKRKNEYELKMKQIDCFVDSSSVTFPQVRICERNNLIVTTVKTH